MEVVKGIVGEVDTVVFVGAQGGMLKASTDQNEFEIKQMASGLTI